MTSLQQTEARHPLASRILHEIIMVTILLLIATGFYIHHPFIGGGGFLMTMVRGVHFFAAGILIITTVLRIVGMFCGQNRDWRSFLPTADDFKLFPAVISYYTYIGKEPELKKKYNPLQMLSYCLVFVLITFQIVSGFALQYPETWMSWFNYGLFNSEVGVRIAHFVVTWLFVMFLMIHIYLTIREKFSEIKEMHLFSSAEES